MDAVRHVSVLMLSLRGVMMKSMSGYADICYLPQDNPILLVLSSIDDRKCHLLCNKCRNGNKCSNGNKCRNCIKSPYINHLLPNRLKLAKAIVLMGSIVQVYIRQRRRRPFAS